MKTVFTTLTEMSDIQRRSVAYQPRFFSPGDQEDLEEIERMIKNGEVRYVHDEIRTQLAGLLETMNPADDFTENELQEKINGHTGGVPLEAYGVWVYFPWSQRLVHVLPEAEFRLLRTSRNRNKITFEEQDVLRKLRIGIVGLSIGHSAATTLTMEEIGGELFLADFDELELSNMNRIRAGVTSLGVNKAVIAARDIYEMNPFSRVTLFTEGVSEKNLEQFLCPDGRALDMVYEECDDLYMKILVREKARALRIPVLMETSDRGMMDIERFDREPDRPIFHGLTGGVRAADLKGLSTFDKVPIVLKIMSQEGISSRMAASMVDIETTIASWPQLASEVALGAAINTDAARRIALGELNSSGRFYADITEMISDGKGIEVDCATSYDVGIVPEALGFDLPPIHTVRGNVTNEDIKTLVSYGSMAFSGGNCQPWRFVFRGTELLCYLDMERTNIFLDYHHIASYLALGSAVENIDLAGQAMGLKLEIDPFPDNANPELVCRIRILSGDGEAIPPNELVHAIIKRVTNRRLGKRTNLPSFELESLSRVAAERGGRLQWIADDDRLDQIGDILADGDLLRMTSKIMHAEMMNEVRWTMEEVERTRDGIDVATLELSATDLAGLKLIRSWRIMKVTDTIGGGLGLKRPMRNQIAAASAVGLLTTPGLAPENFFNAGRVLQQVWLTATTKNISIQPVTPITYLFYRLEQGQGTGLSSKELKKLTALRERYLRVLDVPAGHIEPMIFRVSRTEPPTARALRRKVDDILKFVS